MAKQAYKAMDARHVLSTVGIDWQRSSDNLIYIKTELHRRLHTNMYYSYVNTLVVNAFNKGMSDYKKGAKKSVIKYKVGRTLYWLKQIIRLFDKKRDERIWGMKWILRKP